MSTPQHCPTPRELDDLELLVSGAYAPLTGFNEPGTPVTLDLPEDLSGQEVELVDPEGLPLARLDAAGNVTALTHAQFGPFRRLYLSPGQVREAHAGATFVPVTGPLTTHEIASLADAGRVVLLALVGTGTPEGLSPVGLIRATLAAAEELADASVVAVPLPSHGDPEADHLLGQQVVGNYADSDPVRALAAPQSDADQATVTVAAKKQRPGPSPAVGKGWSGSAKAPDDPAVGKGWSGSAKAPDGPALRAFAQVSSTDQDDAPDGEHPAAVAAVLDFERPSADRQGLVLFFTGLSGSGKSTIARALQDKLLEAGTRSVTSLDGDVVRRNLSAGLTFSKEDRETNIRRIGWVAAEISRHGGVAICSPIAPFDATRQDVRRMVDAAGGEFFLVHVATPLKECERRDRKGLYAKARAGEIPEFTGISSPYEEPADADVRVDTTGRSIEDALDDVLEELRQQGLLDL